MAMAMKNKKKLVTHDGSFHTDDVFACATICLVLEGSGEDYEIIRTRDEEKIKNANYVFDVGGVYDEKANKFDHHQINFKEKRANDIIYSSFGLVWKKFGAEIAGSQKAADLIEKKLVLPIDAWDNGLDLTTNKFTDISPYFIQHLFLSMEPTWREEDLNINDMFLKSVNMAKEILSREVVHAKDWLEAEGLVKEAYKNSKDKRIIVLEKNYPSQYILNQFPEPLFTIYPRKTNNYWGIKAVREDLKTFKNRKDMPKAWAGVRDGELARISGVEDAIFCHKGLFMAVAKSKEGAVKLAEIAVKSSV